MGWEEAVNIHWHSMSDCPSLPGWVRIPKEALLWLLRNCQFAILLVSGGGERNLFLYEHKDLRPTGSSCITTGIPTCALRSASGRVVGTECRLSC